MEKVVLLYDRFVGDFCVDQGTFKEKLRTFILLDVLLKECPVEERIKYRWVLGEPEY